MTAKLKHQLPESNMITWYLPLALIVSLTISLLKVPPSVVHYAYIVCLLLPLLLAIILDSKRKISSYVEFHNELKTLR